MGVPYSDISPNAFSAQLDRLLLPLADLERLALEIGLDTDVVRLCQSALVLNVAIKNAAEGDMKATKLALTAIVEEISQINNRLANSKSD